MLGVLVSSPGIEKKNLADKEYFRAQIECDFSCLDLHFRPITCVEDIVLEHLGANHQPPPLYATPFSLNSSLLESIRFHRPLGSALITKVNSN